MTALLLALALAADPCPPGKVSFGGGCVIDPVPQERCADLLDAGVPIPPVMRITPGTVVDQPLYVMTPSRTCALGAELQTCQAQADAMPLATIAISATGGAAVAVAVVLGVLSASGHLK